MLIGENSTEVELGYALLRKVPGRNASSRPFSFG
jgi:hypothetical protein